MNSKKAAMVLLGGLTVTAVYDCAAKEAQKITPTESDCIELKSSMGSEQWSVLLHNDRNAIAHACKKVLDPN